MARTNSTLVRGVLGDNYDAKKRPDLTPFISAASNVVDQVVIMARKKSRVASMGGLLPAALLDMETWLSAHLYQHSDPGYTTRSTQGGSGGFITGQQTRGFGSTQYGQTAMDLDWSGCLRNINEQQYAGGFSFGNPADACGSGTG